MVLITHNQIDHCNFCGDKIKPRTYICARCAHKFEEEM
jgi:predicted amidophosphoribosyltransferase